MPWARAGLTTLLLLFLLVIAASDGSSDAGCRSQTLGQRLDAEAPFFDVHTPSNVTVQLGSHAYLPCIVRQMADKSVSWVRTRDSHILSVDRYAFIADDRFQSLYQEDSETWTLQIRYAQKRDAGLYECQVSSEPKICHIISLAVVVPRVEIVGDGRELFVNSDSTVTLQCIITGSIENPAFVFWHRDEQRVLATTPPGRLVISETRSSPDVTASTLIISGVDESDSGNYTCSPSNLPTASTMLHVLNGEHHAAMQDGVSSGFPSGPAAQLWLLCALLLVLQQLQDADLLFPSSAAASQFT